MTYALEGSIFVAGGSGAVAARRAGRHPHGRGRSRRWAGSVPDNGGRLFGFLPLRGSARRIGTRTRGGRF